MGATKSNATKKGGSRRRGGNSGGEPADWSSVDPRYIAWVVINVARQGGAVRFGYSKDMGAYAIGFYGDGEPYTEYIRPTENIDERLQEFAERWAE